MNDQKNKEVVTNIMELLDTLELLPECSPEQRVEFAAHLADMVSIFDEGDGHEKNGKDPKY